MKVFIWNLLVNSIGRSYLFSDKFRYVVYKIAGMRTKTKNIRAGSIFRGKSVFIDEGVLINHNCFIDAWERVEIHRNTSVAYGVTISTSSHEIGMPEKRAGEARRRPVIIGEGCWIGANVTILPGVTVADGCVIGAGSVVTRSTEKNGLYLGIPAKRVRTL